MMNHEDTETQRRRLNELSNRVIGLCIEVHRELGPDLLESAYEKELAYGFRQAGLRFERQRDSSLGLLTNLNTLVLKNGIRRVVTGELFREEKEGGSGDRRQLLGLLCASVSLWFEPKF